jgi:RecA-family ATPase
MHHGNDRSAFAKKLLQEGKALVPVEQPTKTDNILINWQDFWTQSFPAEDWLVEPIIPNNQLVVIYAPGGTGKSLLALYVSAALATGREVFGTKNNPVPVLYMDYEMHQAQLYERLTAMGYSKDTDLSLLHYASLPPIGSLDKPEGAKQICDLARACQAKLVIIDTFSRAVEGAENDADTVRNFYRWTALNLKQEGRAMLRIDHAGKDLKKGARGTSAKNDDVDLVWQMTRNDNTVTLKSTKKRHTWIKEKILFTVNKTEQMFTTSSKGQDIHGRCQAFHTAHSVPLTMPASKVLEQYLDIMKQEFGVSKNAYESFRRELKDAELFNSADQ